MERETVSRAIKYLHDNRVTIRELVTDTSSAVRKMIATDHPNIQHSMDIWNKAKKLKKALTEVHHLRLILLSCRQARYKHGKTITVEQKYCKSFLDCCHSSKGD